MIGGKWAVDVECYRNWFFVCALNVENGKTEEFEIRGADARLNDGQAGRLAKLLYEADEIITFNGTSYDLPLIEAATKRSGKRATAGELHLMSDRIISRDERHFGKLRGRFGRHVDVQNLTPGHIGLKEAAVRMDFPKLEELPVDPDAEITPKDARALKGYCRNDCKATAALRDLCSKGVALRKWLNDAYGRAARADFLGRSDAQIGEAIMVPPDRRKFRLRPPPPPFAYTPPDWLRLTGEGKRLADQWAASPIRATDRSVMFANEVPDSVRAGGAEISVGVGGLHSVHPTPTTVKAEDGRKIIDFDVSAYYPNLIMRMGMEPIKGFGEKYEKLVKRRIEAKRAGRKEEDAALKIAINGVFGKLNSAASALYDPSLFAHVTLTGQLALTDLIQRLSEAGATLHMANTDGVVVSVAEEDEQEVRDAAARWEERTGLDLDSVEYNSIHLRDVNNYVAFGTDGKVKRTGAFRADYAERDGAVCLSRQSARMRVVADAVVEHLRSGKDVTEHIEQEDRVEAFVFSAKSSTGLFHGTGDRKAVGRIARWLPSTNGSGGALVSGGGVRLANSENAALIPELPKELPEWLDRRPYVEEAGKMLVSLGDERGFGLGAQADIFGTMAREPDDPLANMR